MRALFCIAIFLTISAPCFAQSGFFFVDERNTNYPEISPSTINPVVIGENTYSEEGTSIIEREYQLNNAGDYLYVKRKYELMPDGNYKLIWRSPESVTLDAAICGNLGYALPEEEAVTIISPDALYPIACGNELQNKSGVVSPSDIVVGDQSLIFRNGNTFVAAGSRAYARVVADYAVRGPGSVWASFDGSASSAGACYARNELPITSRDLRRGSITAFTYCDVTREVGDYPFIVEGCAVRLCSTRTYITHVYD